MRYEFEQFDLVNPKKVQIPGEFQDLICAGEVAWATMQQAYEPDRQVLVAVRQGKPAPDIFMRVLDPFEDEGHFLVEALSDYYEEAV